MYLTKLNIYINWYSRYYVQNLSFFSRSKCSSTGRFCFLDALTSPNTKRTTATAAIMVRLKRTLRAISASEPDTFKPKKLTDSSPPGGGGGVVPVNQKRLS